MKYLVEKAPHRPAYLQLYYQLREDIVNRVYPYHSKLPSKRTLAEDTGTSARGAAISSCSVPTTASPPLRLRERRCPMPL